MTFTRGQKVRIEIPAERPTMFTTNQTVSIRYGIYLGIPKYETTIANVSVSGRIWRLPLEYLSAELGGEND